MAVSHDLMIAHHGEKLVGNLTGASLDRAILDYAWTKTAGLLLIAADGFPHQYCRLRAGWLAQRSRFQPPL